MRADRLLSLLMFLQNRGRTTTDRLAEELEVSRRTIIRDLYALRVGAAVRPLFLNSCQLFASFALPATSWRLVIARIRR